MPNPRPSLFDLQVNGFAGVDFQRPDLTQSNLRRAIEALRAHETLRIFLTLISNEPLALCRQFELIEQFRKGDPLIAETICGYHLEGPFLSPEEGYVGAHSPSVQRAPDVTTFQRLQEAAGRFRRPQLRFWTKGATGAWCGVFLLPLVALIISTALPRDSKFATRVLQAAFLAGLVMQFCLHAVYAQFAMKAINDPKSLD